MKRLLSTFIVCVWLAQINGKVFKEVYYEFGANLGTVIPERVLDHLRSTGVQVSPYSDDIIPSLSDSSLVLSLGNAALSQVAVSLHDVTDEGFRVETISQDSGSTLLACDGLPINPGTRKFALDVNDIHLGAAYCAYATLELLGFAFLHPLSPYTPPQLTLTQPVSRTENPYWEKRTWHIHTQHPLEFTDVLNGYDIPMFSREGGVSKCPPGMHCESWESMFETLDGLFEWLVANRQNRVEVLLLGNAKWEKWNNLTTGTVRWSRLQQINRRSHAFGILIGADIPLANLQQHGMAMVSMRDNLTTQTKDIQDTVDWALEADFDFISTESGLSEFTKPTCELMLQLFEVFTERGMAMGITGVVLHSLLHRLSETVPVTVSITITTTTTQNSNIIIIAMITVNTAIITPILIRLAMTSPHPSLPPLTPSPPQYTPPGTEKPSRRSTAPPTRSALISTSLRGN